MSTRAICIDRQFGSGGHAIGELVSDKLGYSFYDSALVNLAVEKGELSISAAEDADEKAVNPWLYTPLSSGTYPGLISQSGPERMFRIQSEIIQEAAQKENCVFVGRLADAVLEDIADVNIVSFFIYGPEPYRIQRLIQTEGFTRKEAEAAMRKKDKQRRNYYNYYTGREYGNPVNYDFCIDSSYLGINGTAELLCQIIKLSENR